MDCYKGLNRQVFSNGVYSIVPIRMSDRFDIMKWRNEQIYHLRQATPLTEADQNRYFNEVVKKLFTQDHPSDILFSYLEGDKCIGYGGLVHINWIDRNAEISFIMETSLETHFFEVHWTMFTSLIEQVAFKSLSLHKLFVYAFDLRPHLYRVLERCNYFKDATLIDHCFFEGNFIDVVIYSKINNQ